MLIKKITILNFGKLSDKTITPTDGLNVIYAPNEGGKTTLLSFIKYIFYGSKQKKEYKDLSFKERYLPWNSMPMSGSCEIECDIGNYAIQRSDGNNQSKLEVINLKTANEEKQIITPGKEFFGIGEKAFSDSFFIKDLTKFSDFSNDGEIISTLTYSSNEHSTYNTVKSELTEKLALLNSPKRKNSESEIINSDILLYREKLKNCEDKLNNLNEKLNLYNEYNKQYNDLKSETEKLLLNKNELLKKSIINEINNLKDEQDNLESKLNKSYTGKNNLSSDEKNLLINDFNDITELITVNNRIKNKYLFTSALFCLISLFLGVFSFAYNYLLIIPLIISLCLSFYFVIKSYGINSTLNELKNTLFIQKEKQNKLMLKLGLSHKNECYAYISALSSAVDSIDNDYINSRLTIVKEKITILQEVLNNNNIPSELSLPDTIFFTNHKLDDIIKENNVLLGELKEKINQLAYCKYEVNIAKNELHTIQAELNRLNELKNKLNDKVNLIECALDILDTSYMCVKDGFLPELSKRTVEIFNYIVNGDYNYLSFDDEFNILFNKNGFIRNSKFLSTGTFDALYFSLRIAIIELINQKKSVLPVFIDDIFCNCDDDRAENLINIIYNLSKKYQVFVCTCRKRELEFLKNKSNVNIIDIQKG